MTFPIILQCPQHRPIPIRHRHELKELLISLYLPKSLPFILCNPDIPWIAIPNSSWFHILFLFNNFFNVLFYYIKPLPKNNSYQFGKIHVISFRLQNIAHNGRKFNEANKQARPLINNATTICSHIRHRHHHHKSKVTHNLSDRPSASR